MTRPADKRPSPLFHAIVVVGASIGAGCGNDEAPLPDAAPAVADARRADAPAADAPATADADPTTPDAMIIIL
jgi:hypothetical protein